MSLLGGRFGTVDKAAFLIGKKQKDDGTWEYKDPVLTTDIPEEAREIVNTQTR